MADGRLGAGQGQGQNTGLVEQETVDEETQIIELLRNDAAKGADAEIAVLVLGGVQYAENRAILHTDTRLMPRRRLTWSSWNVLQTADTLDASPVCLSYWMNLLQALDTEEEYIVTLNPIREPDPRRVLYETVYTHPQYTPAMMEAQRRLPEIQGKRGIWWCGAWTGYGFHEDGFTSGLNVARALGCAPPWEADAGPS